MMRMLLQCSFRNLLIKFVDFFENEREKNSNSRFAFEINLFIFWFGSVSGSAPFPSIPEKGCSIIRSKIEFIRLYKKAFMITKSQNFGFKYSSYRKFCANFNNAICSFLSPQLVEIIQFKVRTIIHNYIGQTVD